VPKVGSTVFAFDACALIAYLKGKLGDS